MAIEGNFPVKLTELEIREVIKECLLETIRTKSIVPSFFGGRQGARTAAGDIIGLSAIAIGASDREGTYDEGELIDAKRIDALHPDARPAFAAFKNAL